MQTQRHLKIFISSTFQDMDEEREILLKNTFLELKKIAKSRDVEITEIDLRTGITKEQAESGEVVKICLDEVERCADSPIFFLGILGNRYGSVDWLGDVSSNLLEDKKYSWITDFSNRSLTEIEIISALERNKKHNRAFIYLKDGEDDNEKLKNLKNRLIAQSKNSSHIEVTHYKDSSDFKIQTIESFTKALDDLYPKDKKLSELDKLKNSHQIFAKSRQKVYIYHAKNEMILNEFIGSDQDRLLLYGESGYGKSALIANYFEKFKQNNYSFVIEHYIGGAGELSNDLHQMLRRIMLEIKEEFNLLQEVPTEPQKIIDEFAPWLYLVKRPTIIILDGYNQIEDELKEKLFYYIPKKLEKVKLIISSIKDNYPIDNKYKIEPLSKEEKQELIIDYLTHYGKEGMALKIYTHISTHPQTDNTLFLRTLLNEIRLLGNFDNIENDIKNYLQAKDVVGLFIKIFERLESDYRTNLAQEVLSLLYVSRDGLSEDNLMEIINNNSTQKLSRLEFSPLFLALEEHLINKNGLYGFFHDYIREAVKNRYLNSLKLINIERRKIADYFEKREIDNQMVRELPFQLFKLNDKSKLLEKISILNFFTVIQKYNVYELLKYVNFINKNNTLQINIINQLKKTLTRKDIEIISNLANFFHYFYTDYEYAEHLYTICITISEKIYGDKNYKLGNFYIELAKIYLERKKYDETLVLMTEAFDIEDKDEYTLAIKYDTLSQFMIESGSYENALVANEKALAIKKKLFHENHFELLETYTNLINTYSALQEYRKALEISKIALKISKYNLGEKHLKTILLYCNMGDFHLSMGGNLKISLDTTQKNLIGPFHQVNEFKQGVNYYNSALKISEEILGKEHPITADCYYKLAKLFDDGNEASLSHYQKALRIKEKILDENDETLVYLKKLIVKNKIKGIWYMVKKLSIYGFIIFISFSLFLNHDDIDNKINYTKNNYKTIYYDYNCTKIKGFDFQLNLKQIEVIRMDNTATKYIVNMKDNILSYEESLLSKEEDLNKTFNKICERTLNEFSKNKGFETMKAMTFIMK